MKNFKSAWITLALVSFCFLVNSLQSADLTGSYAWKPMKIGGGGWIVGLDMHPLGGGVVYARTDVSGAYLWNAGTGSWKQLVTNASMPAAYVGFGRYSGVDSIVCVPTSLSKVYMSFAGQIFKSTNNGTTWTATNFGVNNVAMAPNGPSRRCGERLGVDPANENVVYYCPINDQPWRTTDGGTTWTKITAVPLGLANWGATTIKFDKLSGTTGGKTNVIYITVENGGVYKSADAGTTWTNIAGTGPGNLMGPRDACIAPDQTYYVSYGTDNGKPGAVWKYTTAGVWTNITPGATTKSYEAVAVDPTSVNRVTVMAQGGSGWTSINAGSSWTSQGWSRTSTDIPWLGAQADWWLSVGQICYDPASSGRLWFGEGFGVWTTTDIADTSISWTSRSQGIEEMCGNDVICAPGGVPVTASWDIGAFKHTNLDSYTGTTRKQNTFISGWSLDWTPANTNLVVGVFHDHTEAHTPKEATGYSTNNGTTWNTFASITNGTHPAELKYGVIAVSATNVSNYVWCPTNNVLPYCTFNVGTTWTKGTFPAGVTTTGGMDAYYKALKPLCSDKVLADTYYFYRIADGIYRSTNNGLNWTRVGNAPALNRWNAQLKAAPGNANHLWFVEGQQTPAANGLWRSIDGGANWTSVAGISKAYSVGFGKALTGGSGYPTIFVAGQVSGVDGIYRSTDSGATWDKVGSYPLGLFDFVDSIDGDKTTFGKVYIAFSGAGFAYGTPTP